MADEADKEDAMIDSTIVRAHQQSWGAKGGSDRRKRWDAVRADSAPRFMQLWMPRVIP